MNIPLHRLYNQQVASHRFEQPGELVSWLGAVQAQDYLGSLWAIGLRLPVATEKMVEQAIASRAIVRTWPMRGTLHFVAAADVHWMLDLLALRVIAGSVRRLERQYELDETVFARSRTVILQALRGGRQLTRPGMYQTLETAGIPTGNQRGLQILWHLAQEGLVCLGTREGKQQTYVLLDEWVPNAKKMERDEALAELARRYFTSHGPATLPDFAWWSGLAASDARAGLEMAHPQLVEEVIEGRAYWMSSSVPPGQSHSPHAYLLPAYDEYTVAYKDRSAILNPLYKEQVDPRAGILGPAVVINGQVMGTWKRMSKKGTVQITLSLFSRIKHAEEQSLRDAVRQYGEFVGLPVEII